MKKQLYFENEDACSCHPLEYFMHDAKLEKQKEITLIEALPAPKGDDVVWCGYIGSTEERSECKKGMCDQWTKGKGNVCDHRGNLFYHGEKATFKV